MGRTRKLVMFVMATLALTSGCRHMNHTERGAATGGAIGALAGAAIGSETGRGGAGAAIGGIAGAAIGAAVGSEADRDERRIQAAMAMQSAPVNGPLSMEEVADMARRGIGEDVIRTQIRNSGTVYHLTPSQIAWLHDNGVSDGVINEMQRTAMRRPRPVYVEPVAPVYVMPPPMPRMRVHGPHFGIGFGFYR